MAAMGRSNFQRFNGGKGANEQYKGHGRPAHYVAKLANGQMLFAHLAAGD